MRRVQAVLCLLMLTAAGLASPAGAGAPGIVLSDVSHTLDGSTLIVTGWVHNQTGQPVSRLVIDVSGFAPSGDMVVFGSDGIPWGVPPGRADRFSVSLPIADRLVRDYTVVVSSTQAPGYPLAGLRRGVDLALYRALVLSRVRVSGDVAVGQLTLRSDVRGMPVAQMTVEATLIVFNPEVNLLQKLTVALPPDASKTFRIGGIEVALVSLRIVDVLLQTAWD